MRPLRVASVALLAAAACGSTHRATGCNTADPSACPGGAVCEPVSGGAPACFPPVVVSGQVTDLATGSPIPGARVVAMDPNRAPASTVATADANGNYSVAVPSTRAPDGTPISSITLRADAQAYQSFPGGLRTALPVDLSTATNPSGSRWNVQGPLTAVKLIHLADTTNLTSIQGIVAKPPSRVGVLVVATPQAGGPARTAIADVGGAYTVFNLPAAAPPGASYTVNAYAQGANYSPAPVALVLGTTPPQVNLFVHDTSAAGFTGNLIFNSGAGAPTSVTLVVQSTYDAALDRGESPPGLVAQVPPGASTYAFTGVPDGTYTALAAFGIDGDVRDESGVGNTAPVQLTVQGGALQGAPTQFKLVGAVALTSIDGIAVGSGGVPVPIASATPAFVWAKAPSYSSAATFDTEVLDAFGTSLWTSSQPGSGSGPFNATYAGPALQSGMYYQLRVTARDGVGNPLSRTEDLRGVFFKP